MQTSALTTPLTLGALVSLEGSTETGTIVARADYLNDATQYQVRYVNGQGCLTTAWWPKEALRTTEADSAPPEAIAIPVATPQIMLAEGERYAGIVLDADGAPSYHLIILPGDVELTWDDAMTWAKGIGAELPTRAEQRLLFCNAKSVFQPAWYWSSEQYAGDASDAWGQGFDNGYQGSDGKGCQGRVRAVRRFLID